MKKIFFVIFSFCFFLSYGQDLFDLSILAEDIVPPTPSSSVYRKYMGEQPDLATGAVRVTIPLYTVSHREVSIPFTLCYRTEGIKVDEDPYPCGYGWAFLPGLRISRTIRGRADEYFGHVHNGSGFEFARECVIADNKGLDSTYMHDPEHDLFTLHLPKNSYSFVLVKKNGQFTAIGNNRSDVRIECDTLLKEFRITDSDGTIYTFGTYYEHEKRSRKNTTAWMLEDIELTNGEHITFDWEKMGHAFSLFTELGPATLVDEAFSLSPQQAVSGVFDRPYRSSDYNGSIEHYGTESMQHLKSVTFPGGHISLSYRSNQSAFITAFVVTNDNGRVIKDVRLNYGMQDSLECKLLKSVDINDEGTYSFEYNPQRFEWRYAQDYWGFYNGHTENLSNDPIVSIGTHINPHMELIYRECGAANKSVDTTMMKANMLTSVRYPTGGTTSFEYEPHILKRIAIEPSVVNPSNNPPLLEGGGLRVRRMTTTDPLTGARVVKSYKYGINENDSAECVDKPFLGSFIDVDYTFARLQDFGQNFQYRLIRINPSSNYADLHFGETLIWYKEVAEYHDEGKTVYNFDNILLPNSVSNQNGHGIISDINKLFSKGIMPKKETVFKTDSNGNYTAVHEHESIYSISDIDYEVLSDLTDLNVKRNYVNSEFGGYPPDFVYRYDNVLGYMSTGIEPDGINRDAIYSIWPYAIVPKTELMVEERFVEHTDDNKTIKRKVKYGHLPNSEIVSSIIQTSSDGDSATVVKDMFYPQSATRPLVDMSQAALLDSMAAHNINNKPYMTTTTIGGQTTGTKSVFSRKGTRLFLPSANYRLKGNDSVLVMTMDYDTSGNLRDAVHYGDLKESFLWGCDGKVPIVSTMGMSYSELAVAAGGVNSLPDVNSAGASSWHDSHIAQFPPAATISAYDYIPLIGMVKKTSPDGTALYFDRDNMGRLVNTRIDGHGSLTRYAYRRYDEVGSMGDMLPSTAYGHNCIITRTMQAPSGSNFHDEAIYYDGLGRPVENVSIHSPSASTDFVQLMEYDGMNRESAIWSPVPMSSDGSYRMPSLIKSASAVAYADTAVYTLKKYEPSKRERLIGTVGAGQEWHSSNKCQTEHLYANVSSAGDVLNCVRFTVDIDGTLTCHGNYNNDKLTVTATTDEDGHTVYVFKDLLDRDVLHRQSDSNSFADTYYVRDNYGDLRMVISPEGTKALGNTTIGMTWSANDDAIRNYTYSYAYNTAGNVTSKRLPGCDEIIYRYDKGEKLLLTQDGNMRSKGWWLITLYDRLRRPVVSGIVKSGMTESFINSLPSQVVTATYTGVGDYWGYETNLTLPFDIYPLKVDYYDNYNYLSGVERYEFEAMQGYGAKYNNTTGRLTGSRVWTLGDSAQSLLTATYYDLIGNIIQTRSDNMLGGMDVVTTAYSYTGKPLSIRHEHSTDSTHHVDISTMTYDAMERLLTTTVTHDGAQVDVISNTYDELGRLESQTCLNNQQTTSYSYNIRNWITGIDAGELIMKQSLHYADAVDGSTPCYNGNISAMDWNLEINNFDMKLNRYCYNYDGMNRLTGAAYTMYYPIIGMGFNNQENFSTSYSYDLNSNITALRRYGRSGQYGVGSSRYYDYGLIDDIAITREGNQLKKVTDQCDELTYAGAMDFKDGASEQVEYTWDANGNMTSDLNKGVTEIKYNILNLPEKITHSDGHITYITYAADGRKLRVTYKIDPTATIEPGEPFLPHGSISPLGQQIMANGLDGGDDTQRPIDDPVAMDVIMTRDYCGAYTYRNGTIERIMMGSGFIQDSVYYVQIKDYQGNVRAVLDQNHNVVERNEYYPYGGLINASDTQLQPYKYSSKELDRQNGLDLYDFSARMYDPMLPGTTTQDPLAEKYFSISPYTWCAGNPVSFVDPSGMDILNGNGDVDILRYEVENKRKLLSNEKNNKEQKVIKNELKKLEKQLKLAEYTQDAINDFRETDPETYEMMNNITYKDLNGNVHGLDIIVSTKYGDSHRGYTDFTPFNEEYGIMPNDRINVTLDFMSHIELGVLPHEMGHVFSFTKSPSEYFRLLIKYPDNDCRDGRSRNMQISKDALDFENKYKKLRYEKTKKH